MRIALLLALGLLVLTYGCQRAAVRAPTAAPAKLRVATYNVSLFSNTAGGLAARLTVGDEKARQAAAVIQRVRPDILLLNEFDYEPEGAALAIFLRDYLGVSQQGGDPIEYPHQFQAPVNTGVPSGLDLDLDGRSDGPNDAWGFGHHPGQFGMLALSRHPIAAAEVRSFQHFRWSAMPGALQPQAPGSASPYYPDDVWKKLKLSSKSHWDLPIATPLGTLHFLVMHPTPPVFDGPEDRNGRRNHDEVRLMTDYLDAATAGYLVDDQGRQGAIEEGARFVIAGDLNSDPVDGDSLHAAMTRLLAHPRVDGSFVPKSAGAAAYKINPMGLKDPQRGDPAARTSNFGLRVDYVLPSRDWRVVDGGVFWPPPGDPDAKLTGASDHHLVWLDLAP